MLEDRMLRNTLKFLFLAALMAALIVGAIRPHNFGLSDQPAGEDLWPTPDLILTSMPSDEEIILSRFNPSQSLVLGTLLVTAFTLVLLWPLLVAQRERTPTLDSILRNSRYPQIQTLHSITKPAHYKPKPRRTKPRNPTS